MSENKSRNYTLVLMDDSPRGTIVGSLTLDSAVSQRFFKDALSIHPLFFHDHDKGAILGHFQVIALAQLKERPLANPYVDRDIQCKERLW